MLQLGITAGRQGGAAPAVYNAANEVAVAHFLDERLPFAGIAACVSAVVDALGAMPGDTLDALLAADAAARDAAHDAARDYVNYVKARVGS